MEINQSDDFEVIDSQYQLIQSTMKDESSKIKNANNYDVMISPTKNEVDLNFVENQYYQFQVTKKGQLFCRVQRRFSEFQLMFEILSKKQGGFIFPAFPANGLFAFIKSKVSLSKDEQFVKRRTKMIARFFNRLINNPLFDPQFCSQMKIFLSPGKQFEARKQIQKGNKGYFNMGWNKLKTYFVLGKQNKYADAQVRISHLKGILKACTQNVDSQFQNSIFQNNPFSAQRLNDFAKMMEKHDKEQLQNYHQLQELEFELFCQNEDLQMVNRIFDRIGQLKDDEDNNAQLKNIQQKLEGRLQQLIAQKQKNRKSNELKLKWIIEDIKTVGRIGN